MSSAESSVDAPRYVLIERWPSGVKKLVRKKDLVADLEAIYQIDSQRATSEQYAAIQRAIAEHRLDSNVSVKLTALGLLIDEERCVELVRGIAERAARNDNFVRIDMEDSSCTDATLRLYRELRGSGLDNVRLRLTHSTLVDEPVVRVVLRVGCYQTVSRSYVLLADLPSSGPFVTMLMPSSRSDTSHDSAQTFPAKSRPYRSGMRRPPHR